MAYISGGMLNLGNPYGGMMYSVGPTTSASQLTTHSNSWHGAHSSNGSLMYSGNHLNSISNSSSFAPRPKSQSMLYPQGDLEFMIFDEKSPRSSEIRDLAEKWAAYEGFPHEQVVEFNHLMQMALSQYIPKSRLIGSVQIDAGSFGKIYRCEYDGTEVAVKEIGKASDGQCNVKTKMRELLLELRVLIQIRHPNVVGYWGTAVEFSSSSSSSPSMSLVFEMCSNGSLHNRIFDDKYKDDKLSVLQKVTIAKQVAVGLSYLHSKLIVHRDLNTRNVLLTGELTAKIADFGCARFLSEKTGTLRTTTILGSPAYMPPEQLQGGELSDKVDVWALALLLWEVMVEAKPWEGLYTEFSQLKDAVCRGQRVEVPAELAAAFPSTYLIAFKAGMSLSPQDRPSAAAMQRELAEAVVEAAARVRQSPMQLSAAVSDASLNVNA